MKRGVAIPANKQAMGEMKSKEAAKQHKIELEKQAANETAQKLEGKTVKLTAKAGANGKLFGSVTSKEIAEAIEAQMGAAVDKKKITLSSEIKAFGTYNIEIKLYQGISAKMFVTVTE